MIWHHPRACAALSGPVLLALAGCGTITLGTHQTLRVASKPLGAQVVAQPASDTIITPGQLELRRTQDYTLTFSRDGYHPATFRLKRRLDSGALMWNLWITLGMGFLVDAITGSTHRFEPTGMYVTLRSISDSTVGPDEIVVAIVPEPGGHGLRIESDMSVNVSAREIP